MAALCTHAAAHCGAPPLLRGGASSRRQAPTLRSRALSSVDACNKPSLTSRRRNVTSVVTAAAAASSAPLDAAVSFDSFDEEEEGEEGDWDVTGELSAAELADINAARSDDDAVGLDP